jgi:hypothetical protein
VSLLQGHEVAGLIVGSSFDPAAVEDRTPRKLQADGDRRTTEALAKLLGPGANGRWSMLEDKALELGGPWDSEAHVVFSVRPVDADECYELFLHVVSSRRLALRDMHSLPSEVDMESR